MLECRTMRMLPNKNLNLNPKPKPHNSTNARVPHHPNARQVECVPPQKSVS
jgi:hypothetical protein